MKSKIPLILLGNTLYAFAVAVFILPNKLITGGTTGLALIAEQYMGIPLTIFVACFNVLMFILGGFILGKAFALTTVLSTFYYPFILGIFQELFGKHGMTQDILLATLFGGMLIGCGIGLVIRAGASTGGMDIPPLILQKKWGLPVATTLLVIDACVLLGQVLFSGVDQILYGILLVILYTMVLERVLVIGRNQMQVKVISEKSELISEAIRTKLDRGTTLLHSEGGHTRKENYAVLTIVGSREIAKVNDLVIALDPQAFIVMNQVKEVKGRGFTLGKQYIEEGNAYGR